MQPQKSEYTKYTCGCYGFIANGGKDAYIEVPFGLWVEITEKIATVSELVASVRTVNGTYLGGAINTDLTSYVLEKQIRSQGRGIEILLRNTAGWGITNNTPLAGLVMISFTVGS